MTMTASTPSRPSRRPRLRRQVISISLHGAERQAVWESARKYARRHKMSLSGLIIEALSQYLLWREEGPRRA